MLNQFLIFVIRAVLGIVFGIILIRVFYPQGGVVWVLGAAIALVGLAYITAGLRKKKDSEGHRTH